MTKIIFSVLAIAAMGLAGCGNSKETPIPLSKTVKVDDTYTIIWNGVSEAYRYENEKWVRAANYDYQFDVIQKRYENQWKSVKSLHRIHPDYDGKAGDRDQTMYFDVLYKQLKGDKVRSAITSSLGNGTGLSDIEFRDSKLEMDVENASFFLPYNKFRITQHYNYEEGLLTETVELLKVKDGVETPFMKNEEKAWFFIKGKLATAPTSFKP